jgi:hypothetical protein
MTESNRTPLLRRDWFASRVQSMTPETIAMNLRELRAQASRSFRWSDGEPMMGAEITDTRQCIALLEAAGPAPKHADLAGRRVRHVTHVDEGGTGHGPAGVVIADGGKSASVRLDDAASARWIDWAELMLLPEAEPEPEAGLYRLATEAELADECSMLYAPFGGETAAIMRRMWAPQTGEYWVALAVCHVDDSEWMLSMFLAREDEDEDRQCGGCDDETTLSSRGLCDGCEEEVETSAREAAERDPYCPYVPGQLVHVNGRTFRVGTVVADVPFELRAGTRCIDWPSRIYTKVDGEFIDLPLPERSRR